MAKVHLISTPDPIPERSTVSTACGEEFTSPAICFVWEGDISGNFRLDLPCICRKCTKSIEQGRYIYGIVSRQYLGQLQRVSEWEGTE
jgi:hypothetical protein